MKKILNFVLGSLLLAAVFILVGKIYAGTDANPQNDVRICHSAGGSGTYTNPTVNANGSVDGHAGGSHQNGNDIIPSFYWQEDESINFFPGQNWDTQGQAIWNNGCVAPTPVDCVMSEWSACSATCGGGTRTRTVVTPAQFGGQACGSLEEACNTQSCKPTASVRLTSMCKIDDQTGKMRLREEGGQACSINWNAKYAGGSGYFNSGSFSCGQTIYFNAPAGKTIIVDWSCPECETSGSTTKAQNNNLCETTDECPNLEGVQATVPDGYLKDREGSCLRDLCTNIEGLQTSIPEGYQDNNEDYICESSNQCEQTTWTCGQCQTLNDDICYEDQETYCRRNYDCHWTDEEVSQWSCSCPTPSPSPSPTVGKQSKLAYDIFCDNNNFTAIMDLTENSSALTGLDVTFKYNGVEKKDDTDSKGRAVVYFEKSGDHTMTAIANGFGEQSIDVKMPTNCESKENNKSSGTVLGTTTSVQPRTGQVLGASTLAATGNTANYISYLIISLGLSISALSVYQYVKNR